MTKRGRTAFLSKEGEVWCNIILHIIIYNVIIYIILKFNDY